MPNSQSEPADKRHEEAREFDDPEAARGLHHRVLELDPGRPTILDNGSLIHKYH